MKYWKKKGSYNSVRDVFGGRYRHQKYIGYSPKRNLRMERFCFSFDVRILGIRSSWSNEFQPNEVSLEHIKVGSMNQGRFCQTLKDAGVRYEVEWDKSITIESPVSELQNVERALGVFCDLIPEFVEILPDICIGIGSDYHLNRGAKNLSELDIEKSLETILILQENGDYEPVWNLVKLCFDAFAKREEEHKVSADKLLDILQQVSVDNPHYHEAQVQCGKVINLAAKSQRPLNANRAIKILLSLQKNRDYDALWNFVTVCFDDFMDTKEENYLTIDKIFGVLQEIPEESPHYHNAQEKCFAILSNMPVEGMSDEERSSLWKKKFMFSLDSTNQERTDGLFREKCGGVIGSEPIIKNVKVDCETLLKCAEIIRRQSEQLQQLQAAKSDFECSSTFFSTSGLRESKVSVEASALRM